MADVKDFDGLDPMEDSTAAAQSHSFTAQSVEVASCSAASAATAFQRSDLINLTTSGKDSPLVSSVRRKPVAHEKQTNSTSHVPSSSARSPNVSGSGYVPGSYSQKVKSNTPGFSYIPGSYSQQRRHQRSTPTHSKPRTASNLKVSTTSTPSTATASSLINFDSPLYSSLSTEAPAAEPAVTMMEPFKLPTSEIKLPFSVTKLAAAETMLPFSDTKLAAAETIPNLSAPFAMHVANPAATLDDPTNVDATEALMKKLSVTGNGHQNNSMKEARRQPALSAIDILTAAGVDINIDNLEATHDGKAPLELVGSFLTCVMNQKYEAGLILCQHVLRFEPENETAREFYPVIVEKIHRESFGSDSNSGDSSEEEESSEDSDESDSSESESNSEGISSSEQEDEAVNEHMRNVSLPPTHPSQ
ncbi:uncharacterized protein LOC134195242 [Corticium candelabrum]|uniref:uncharacterized protein LOC134195242 n=1 Tax=Corticium candelabrum TaxID=121492 RepID=UPI002E26631E|nr:uncharacterized protein LOC134195242 [Corticium candelabrum]